MLMNGGGRAVSVASAMVRAGFEYGAALSRAAFRVWNVKNSVVFVLFSRGARKVRLRASRGWWGTFSRGRSVPDRRGSYR